jgi:hypothetical protein
MSGRLASTVMAVLLVGVLLSWTVGPALAQQNGSNSSGGGESGEEAVDPEEMGVPFQAHYVGIATMLMMIVSLGYAFFLLKYGESPNAKAGNR